MSYQSFRSEEELRNLLGSSNEISGKFVCDYVPQSLSDESYWNKTFKNCLIIKGSFVSCSFHFCIFENVIFRETDFAGTNFTHCFFIDCIFSNVDSGYTMEKTQIDHLSEFFEDEKCFELQIEQFDKKTAGKPQDEIL